GGDFGDGADLGGEIGGQKIDVAGQIFPGAGGSGDVGLSAQTPFHADFAGHVGDLFGEGGQRIGHVVNRVGQGRHFAFGFHGEFLAQIAVRHGRDDLDDAAHLIGEVGGHDVDVVGQFLPDAGDAGDLSLAAQFAFGADLAGHASDFGGESVQLI